MDEILQQIQTGVGAYLPNLLLAIGILIVGWLVALLVSALTRRLLNRTTLDDRIVAAFRGDKTVQPDTINVEKWISTFVFWIIMLLAIVAFLQTLNLTVVSEPINNFLNEIFTYIPDLFAGIVLLFLAWLLATFLRMLVVRVLDASGISRTLSDQAEVEVEERVSISQTIGNVVYWLVFLLFLPAVLDALNLQGILAPIQRMVEEIVGFLPNLFAAALILVLGWLVARIVRQIVTSLLASVGVDNLGDRVGVSNVLGQQRLSSVIGTIVYVLILIPVAIAALNALDIPAISQPAAGMLTTLLNALPAIFGAFLLLGLAYFVARLVGSFVAGILTNLGFDNLFTWLGIRAESFRTTPRTYPGVEGSSTSEPEEYTSGRLTPSEIVGYLTTIAIMLFAVMEASNLLGFEILAVLISQFVIAAGSVLVGLLIFALGLYFSSLAERVIRGADISQADILAPVARVAIIVFASALALREMGIAESIVNLAFGLILGAVAVAVALAFGLGGRDVAARQLNQWHRELQESPQGSERSSNLGASPSNPVARDTDL
ncbi:MAG TPA: mechanosensitive ion channel [Anaerolineales bacterium]